MILSVPMFDERVSKCLHASYDFIEFRKSNTVLVAYLLNQCLPCMKTFQKQVLYRLKLWVVLPVPEIVTDQKTFGNLIII